MKRQISVVLLTAVSVSAYAASDSTLPDVVVTATRTPQSADASIASVTVITPEDIKRMQAQSLPPVLRGVAGLTISNNGGAGKATSVFLRGHNADQVLVLIDGLKVGSATTGTASYQDIPLEQIERIEIVRGPRASLYGSEAVGGVIQIFTRKGGAPFTGRVTLGSYGTQDASLALNRSGEAGWLSAVLDRQYTSGFNACNGPGGCYVIEPDKDGYRNLSFGLRGGYRFAQSATAEFNALQADSKVQTDGSKFGGNEAGSRLRVLGGSLKLAPVERWKLTLRGGRSLDNSEIFFNGLYISRFNTQRDNLSWQNDVALDEAQLLTLGLDYQHDRIDALPTVALPTKTYAQTARSNRALFGQYLANFGAHELRLSARRDRNQQFGTHNSGGVGYGYELSDGTRLTVSWGSAFKAPTFNQLYYPGFGTPTLRPESSRSLELGLDGFGAVGKWSLHAYQTRLSDLIGFDALFKPANINRARISGVEGTLRTWLSDWEINTTLTLQDPRQDSGANQGKLLNRRATETVRIELARDYDVYRFAASLYAEGRRFDDLANRNRLGGYALLDMRAEYRLNANWLLQGRIDNLLDKQYQTAQYFNQARRGVYFTLNYQAL